VGWLGRLLGGERQDRAPARRRILIPEYPSAIYAIGDVHGGLAELHLLHQAIFADSAGIPGQKYIVTLGDYVDRGPDSAAVLDYLLGPLPPDFQRICLAGNHDVLMLEHLSDPGRDNGWLEFGGQETLASYGVSVEAYMRAGEKDRRAQLGAVIPTEHIEFLRNLPVLLRIRDTLFVHAGVCGGVPCLEQDESDLLWRRQWDGAIEGNDWSLLVHGHTPATEPLVESGRIGIDTGAFATGVLTAVRLMDGRKPLFLKSGVSSEGLM